MRNARYALCFTLVYPTALTYLYFVALADASSGLQQAVFSTGKIIQFGFPIAWVACVQKEAVKPRKPDAGGLAWPVGFGLAIMLIILALYHGWLQPGGYFEGPGRSVRAKLAGMDIVSLPAYALTGIFYSVAHSLLEEYYWRWFVFKQLRRMTGTVTAVLSSGLGFMAHHVVVLVMYFGWLSPLTWIFSMAVAGGGMAWAWMYEKSGTLYGPWYSHMLVDAGIFIVGYDLAKPLLQ